MPKADAPAFCTYQPLPGEVLKTACPDCGHAAALHIGVEHCPVCELVQHNQRLRAEISSGRIEVHVTGVDDRALERAIERISLRNRNHNRFLGSSPRR